MSEEQNFKPGDKVQMKSGGPAMTIVNISGDNAECMWMQLKSKASYDQKTGSFPLVALIPYKRQAVGVTYGAIRNRR